MSDEKYNAYELVAGNPIASVFFSCEHASQEMPPGWEWDPRDERLIDTHWAYDLGAAELTHELAERYDAGAILARFSRLLIDPNREPESDTLFRDMADGESVYMNAEVSPDDAKARLESCYLPFHDAFHQQVEQANAGILFSVHSFTPTYEGHARAMEVGVLFDQDEALAHRVAAAFEAGGFRVALNEPYSGKGGLMYSVQAQATAHGRRAVELEVRQDLAVVPEQRRRVVDCLVACENLFG